LAYASGSEVFDERAKEGWCIDARVDEKVPIFGGESGVSDNIGNFLVWKDDAIFFSIEAIELLRAGPIIEDGGTITWKIANMVERRKTNQKDGAASEKGSDDQQRGQPAGFLENSQENRRKQGESSGHRRKIRKMDFVRDSVSVYPKRGSA
jgi:hypothetical protein